MPITRQRRRPIRHKSTINGAGIGIDAAGDPVIDPTENVLALVDAETRFQNAMRETESKHRDRILDLHIRRLDDMAELRKHYETRMSDVLTVQVKTTSELISTQLDKVTTALGTQITTLANTLMDRIGRLEQFRWEIGGKSSVADPAMADLMHTMTAAITTISTRLDKREGAIAGSQETRTEARLSTGALVAIFAAAVGAAMLISAVMFGIINIMQRPPLTVAPPSQIYEQTAPPQRPAPTTGTPP